MAIQNPLYGSPSADTFSPLYGVNTPSATVINILSSTTTIIFTFIIGSILFLITKKKIFIIIPLILTIVSFVLKFISKIFGIF